MTIAGAPPTDPFLDWCPWDVSSTGPTIPVDPPAGTDDAEARHAAAAVGRRNQELLLAILKLSSKHSGGLMGGAPHTLDGYVRRGFVTAIDVGDTSIVRLEVDHGFGG